MLLIRNSAFIRKYSVTPSRIKSGVREDKKFARGIPLEVGDKSTFYDRLGYWDSSYKEINVDDSIRHGILIPQIPFESIGMETQTGRRAANEDKFLVEKVSERHVFVAVFDGHGNDMCAEFCKNNFVDVLREQLSTESTGKGLYNSMKIIDEQWEEYANDHYKKETAKLLDLEESGNYAFELISSRENEPSKYYKSGTTATVLIIEDGYVVYYCWVGDSRAILCRNGVPKRLTFDHSIEKSNPLLEKELKRIKECGGEIYENNGIKRINCADKSINMTRAIGDVELKPFGIICEPSTSDDLPKGDPDYARFNRINHNNDSFICIISDGVSGPLTAKEVVDTIHSKANAIQGAKHLVDTALHLGSQDNCTAVVVPLGAWGKYISPANPVRHVRHFIGSPGRY